MCLGSGSVLECVNSGFGSGAHGRESQKASMTSASGPLASCEWAAMETGHQRHIWKICLSNLSGNLLEATELANVLQEVSSNIQVTGLCSSLSIRTSTSTCGTPTKLSARERISRAVPLHTGAGAVPWGQLVAVVSSDALQEPGSPHDAVNDSGSKQPQLLEVNTGGTVFILFFRLTKQQQIEQQLLRQQLFLQQPPKQQQQQQQQLQGLHIPSLDDFSGSSSNSSIQLNHHPAEPALGTAGAAGAHAADPYAFAREGVAVLKVGSSRLAMQAEQFANELTRHLGIAAPDCRIVRQVGATAEEWTAAVNAAGRLVNTGDTSLGQPQHPQHPQQGLHPCSPARATGDPVTATDTATGSCNAAGVAGDAASGDAMTAAGVLLLELSHLPCFLLMEFVDGPRLSDSAGALQGPGRSQLLQDVGRLFLLDMLLGNADRMPCSDLGWRGNTNNLLYGAAGTRHTGRPVAIDSCVARRPPALKASAEDAAVERLAQLLLAAPEISRSLLGQLLGNLRNGGGGSNSSSTHVFGHSFQQQQAPTAGGRCSRLSDASLSGGPMLSSTCSGVDGLLQEALSQVAPVGSSSSSNVFSTTGDNSSSSSSPSTSPPAAGDTDCEAAGCGTAAVQGGFPPEGSKMPTAQLDFTDEDVQHFQAGLRECLAGVLQIKGLLEMVSNKVSEWIAEFVEDVVRLNPALLPSPAAASPVTGVTVGVGGSVLRSPRPSPRLSRSSINNLTAGGAAGAGITAAGGAVGPAVSPAAAAASPSGGGFGGAGGFMSCYAQSPPASSGGVFSSGGSSNWQQPVFTGLIASSGGGAPLAAAAAGGGGGGGGNARGLDSGSALNTAGRLAAAVHGEQSSAGLPPLPSGPSVGGAPPSPLRDAATAVATTAATAAASGGGSAAASGAPGSLGGAASTAVDIPGAGGTGGGRLRSEAGARAGLACGSPSKGNLLHRRSASQLGFASIKAAICSAGSSSSSTAPLAWSPRRSSNTASTAPPAAAVTGGTGGSGSASPPVAARNACSSSQLPLSVGSLGPPGEVATAVVAVLSPRATQLQEQALVGVFGGSSPGAAELWLAGGGGGSSGSGSGAAAKPSCARRVTWGADEACSSGSGSGSSHQVQPGGVSPKLSPRELLCSDSRLPFCSVANSSSQQRHSNTWLPPTAATSAGGAAGGAAGGTLPAAPAAAAAAASPHHQVSRHLSFISSASSNTFTTGFGVNSSCSNNSFSTQPSFVSAAATASSPTAASQQQQQQQQLLLHNLHQRSPSSTLQTLAGMKLDATLASISQEARHDGVLAERLAHWRQVFREKGHELSAAIAAWQSRHQQAAVLSTGFLDGSHPIVDAYELGVRLQHMLRRLTALAAGSSVQVPLLVLPRLFLGNAVAADSHHLLQHLGVTHMVNAAKVSGWIDQALSGGGCVLVHCHEGKSRSVALLMAHLMISKGHTLASAFAHVRSVRPAACPNAGFMSQLMLLDRQLHGNSSMAAVAAAGLLPRAKPEARICSICGSTVGLSYASLLQHTKTKHRMPLKAQGAAGADSRTCASSETTISAAAKGADNIAAVQVTYAGTD